MADEREKDQAAKKSALAQALVHPLRGKVLRSVRRGHSSATEIAEVLSAPKSSVSEQLRRLSQDGLVYVSEVKNRRGAVQRFYRAHDEADHLEGHELEGLGPEELKRIEGGIIRMFLTAAASATRSKYPQTIDSVLWSITRPVDDEGLQQLRDLHRELAQCGPVS